MPDGIGYLTIAGVGAESTPGTAVNATQRVPNLEFTPDKEYAFLLDESLSGNVFRHKPDLGVVDIRGTWRCLHTYRTAEVILTHFFGSLSSGRYVFADNLTATMTWAIDKQVSVWELSGVFINSMVLNITAGFAELSGTLIATGLVYTGAQNTSAELANLLPVTARKCKLAPDALVRLGVDTAALSGSDDLSVQSGTITLNRSIAETHVSGQREIITPTADNFADGAFELTLTRYDTNQYKTWLDANTSLQMSVLFDEEDGSGTKTWLLPHVTLESAPNPVSGPSFIPQTITGSISTGVGTYSASNISAANADNSINSASSAFPYIHPGAKLWTSGFTGTATNNEQRTVVSRTTAKIVLSGGTALVDDSAGETVTIVYEQPPVYITET